MQVKQNTNGDKEQYLTNIAKMLKFVCLCVCWPASRRPGPSVATVNPVLALSLCPIAFIHALHSPPTPYYILLSSTNEYTVFSIASEKQKIRDI